MCGMKVIGAGWGRTGTTSVAAALERLGFGPCLKMREMWGHLELAETWNRHNAGDRADWRSVLAGWQATVDWPGCWEWAEFARLWPDAPVLLTVRDPGDWYDSVRNSIHAWTAPGADVGPPEMQRLIARVWEAGFGGWDRVLDRDHAIECFERHNADVRATCPRGRLIEFSVAGGWEPLCRPLGVPVPDEPFPYLNRR
jgi:Sulfotransferase domain